MSKINILKDETINKIAAGEVIERPKAIVKELVENSIDAKATAITIEIKGGGTRLVRVTDDGDGLAKEDIKLAFRRHCTSKIEEADDLYSVTSLGFRGEALASIAAVSKVELITKRNEDFLGYRYLIDGVCEGEIEEVGAPDGTTFLVKELFFNTPARKKFLKSETSEVAQIVDLLEKIALSHPEIALKLFVNGKIRLQSAGNNNIKDIIYNIYGKDVAKGLIEINYQKGAISIGGFLGKPLIAKSNRTYENYFVNGRYVKNKMITNAIEEAYHGRMMQGKFPFTCLYINLDPGYIDVNIHPTKLEVKFNNGEELEEAIIKSIREALGGKDITPKVKLSNDEIKEDKEVLPEPFEIERRRSKKDLEEKLSPIELREEEKNYLVDNQDDRVDKVEPILDEVRDKKLDMVEISDRTDSEAINVEKSRQVSLFDISEESVKKIRIIGQAFRTYWIIEIDEVLFIMDQHAAHEKVLFERLMQDFREKKIIKQSLAVPMTITLSAMEANLLIDNLARFESLGFDIEEFGQTTFTIRSIPYNLYKIDKRELFEELLSDIFDGKSVESNEKLYIKIATMACKAAVKGNNKLTELEVATLLDDMLKLDNPYQCPHGRPTVIKMTKRDIDKKFARII